MSLFGEGHKRIPSEWLIALPVVMIITLASMVVMLFCTSPEFSWDEAYRLPYTANSWRSLRGGAA